MKKAISTILASFITLATLFAQSPGGVYSGNTNVLWLDASRMSQVNNSFVSNWNDFSGKGNNALSQYAYNRPLFKTNIINGLHAIQFDGVDDRLRTGSISALNTNRITSFAVFSSTATNPGILYRYAYTTGGGDSYLSQFIYGQYYNPSASELTYIVRNSAASPPPQKINKNPYSGQLNITTEVWDASTSLEGYYNGSLVQSIAGSNSNPGGHLGVSLGANYNSTPSYLKCLFAEKITYSKKLSSAEVNIIENYLAAKYNISISNDLYAYDATAPYELIGIGKESDGSNLSAKGTSPLGLSVVSLSNGVYLLAGHNNAGYSPNTTDVPTGLTRFNQIWRAGVTGAPGLVTVTFDVSTYGLGQTSTYKLLVDGDGIFATGSTSYNGVYSSGTVTFTGVSLTAGSYFTLANSNGVINSTNITTDWHTSTTWDCGCVPVAGMTVNILTGHTVDINGQNAFSGSLTIDGTLTFSGTSDTLSILKNLVNNNILTTGTGTILLNGTTSQSLSGVLSLNNLTINNSSGVINSGTMSIGPGAFLDVKLGSLNTGNNLTFLSNSTGSGALRNPSAGSIVGDVTVQRYLNEGQSWYLLASPLTNSTLEDWNGEFEMQGFPGTEWPTAPNASVYYYDETALVTSYYDGYKIPTNTSNIATNTVGWEAYIGNDSYGAIPKTINATGTPRLGNGIVINGTTSGALGDPSLDGWNLVGNPYQSPVLFLNVAKSANFDVAYRKKASGASQAINFTDIISPGEAIWLHCVGGPCSLTFDANDVNSTNIDNYNLRAANSSDNLIVKLNYDNEYDEVEIDFNELATDNYDRGLDAYKLNNSFKHKPNLAIVNNQNHNLNKAVFNTDFNNSIPLRVYTTNPSGEDKKYSLSFENIANVLGRNKRIVLEDRQLNTFTELTSDVRVDFKMNDTEKTPRFYLNISTPLAISKQNITCFGANNGKIDVVTTDVKKITVFEAVTNSKKTILPSQGVSSITGLAPGKYKIVVETNQFGLVSDYITIEEPLNVQSEFVTINTEEILNGASLSSSSEVLQVKQNQRIEFKNISTNSDKYIWDFGDGITSNLVNPEHVYFKPGSYTVTLKSTNGNCSSISGKTINVEEKILIAESNLLEEVNVITNKNNIFVYMNNNNNIDNVKFEVLNAVGQVVYSSTKTLNNNHIENIYMNEASGLYFINIQGFGYSKTKKIVLN